MLLLLPVPTKEQMLIMCLPYGIETTGYSLNQMFFVQIEWHAAIPTSEQLDMQNVSQQTSRRVALPRDFKPPFGPKLITMFSSFGENIRHLLIHRPEEQLYRVLHATAINGPQGLKTSIQSPTLFLSSELRMSLLRTRE